ncbi:MAG: hypothetical protein R3321_01435 [Nitrososphaeraceae archaeon]|nr:hypothetical protein [Nitrososphaeraceae archaeon]
MSELVLGHYFIEENSLNKLHSIMKRESLPIGTLIKIALEEPNKWLELLEKSRLTTKLVHCIIDTLYYWHGPYGL